MTTFQKHGPESEYDRIGVPKNISTELNISPSKSARWEIINDHSVILHLIDNE